MILTGKHDGAVHGNVFGLFKQDKAYFSTAQKAMINLQVDDLDGVLDRLIGEGVTVDPKRESYDFGKFGWITDPEGNRVERFGSLWGVNEVEGAGWVPARNSRTGLQPKPLC